MIDFSQFTVSDLKLFGLSFQSEEAARQYATSISRSFRIKMFDIVSTRLPRDKYTDFNLIYHSEDRIKWLKKNFSGYPLFAEQLAVELGWKILCERDSLPGAAVDHSFERRETPLTDLPLSPETCDFLYLYGLDTVGDVLSAGDLSYLERTYPKKAGNFLKVVLEYLIPEFASKEVRLSFTDDQTLRDLLDQYRDASPASFLSLIRRYIRRQVENYRDGLQTKEDFFYKTYPFDIAPQILKLKNYCSPREFTRNIDLLKKTHAAFLRTGRIKPEAWMADFLGQLDDIEETMKWFFEINDALMIPLELYLSLDRFGDFDSYLAFPQIIRLIDGDHEYFALTKRCLDLNQVSQDPDPISKCLTFHFEDATTAQLTVESLEPNITGTGTIEGYMSEPGAITVRSLDGADCFCFDRQKTGSLYYYLQYKYHPIPHPDWDQYNTAAQLKQNAVATEYHKRILSAMEAS